MQAQAPSMSKIQQQTSLKCAKNSRQVISFKPIATLSGPRFAAGNAPAAAAPLARGRIVAMAAVADAPRSMKAKKRPAFPFTSLAGQEDMKLALLLNVVDSGIGGVLIMGDRGCGKSVAVRSLVDLLPDIDVVVDDPFNSSPTDGKVMGPECLARYLAGEKLPSIKIRTPLVELPLGATEDRICGTIDIEKALTEGIKAYEPGLLAKANRGILYVDEVNLLEDGLVDVVLDSAAGGQNTVEREGISIVHPAKFIMIGSGNPAEGELRPQLLDRFGLSVNVVTLMDVAQRTQMVLDRMAYEANADAFVATKEAEQEAMRKKLEAARTLLPKVKLSRDIKLKISELCSLIDVDGLRGDIVINRTVSAYVAFEGRTEVTIEDVQRIAPLCLNHRLRKDPLDPIDSGTKVFLAMRRVFNPKAAEEEERKKKEAEAAAAAAAADKAKANKPAGAWGGLPSRMNMEQALGSMPQQQQQQLMQAIESMQVRDSLRMYNSLVERCFKECVDSFRKKDLDNTEEKCVQNCCEKFMKHSARVGMRFGELSAAAETQMQQVVQGQTGK